MKTMLYAFWLVFAIFNGSALASDLTQRSPTDITRDLSSKPLEVIDFAGVKKGDSVLDFLAGGGYYSELLANKVAEIGSVVLHNNKAYLPYIGKELEQRLANDRLKNVTSLLSEADSLAVGEDKYDVIFFVLGYHDLFVTDENWQVTAEQVIPQLLKALKPSGKLLIVDHSAPIGSGSKDAQKLHRIEKAFVKQEMIKGGFKFEKSSDLLINPEDPRNISVFEASIRRKTDRFVLLFSKPAL